MSWLTTVDAARILSVDQETVRSLVRRGKLKGYRRRVSTRNRHWLRSEDVYHYRAAQRQEASK